jgi:hypothetical protein
MVTQIKTTQQIGHVINTVITFEEKLSTDMLNIDILENIKNLFKTKYLKKAYEVFYIINMDLKVLDSELPMINNDLTFSINILCDVFSVVVNDIVKCNLVINNTTLQAYSDKILCDIIQNNEYNINISEKNIIYKGRCYYNNEEIDIIVKKVKNLSSSISDRILIEGDIYNGIQY